jgi:heme-degrading monooxygenase HmoA
MGDGVQRAGKRGKIRKFKVRNPKQIQNTKEENSKHPYFETLADFEFRAWFNSKAARVAHRDVL